MVDLTEDDLKLLRQLKELSFLGEDMQSQILIKSVLNQDTTLAVMQKTLEQLAMQHLKTEESVKNLTDAVQDMLKTDIDHKKDIDRIDGVAAEAKNLAKKALDGTDEKVAKSNTNNRWFFGIAVIIAMGFINSHSNKVDANSMAINSLRITFTNKLNDTETKLLDKFSDIKDLIHDIKPKDKP